MKMKIPAHPGEVLSEDFLKPLAISVTDAAKYLKVSRKHLSNVINGHSSFTADTAARVAALTNTSAKMWLGMQSSFDLAQLDMAQYDRITCDRVMPSVEV